MKLDVHIIDIVVTSCHYCFASPRWQGESVNGEGQHWSHLTCLFLTGVIELPQYDCQGKRSQSRTKKKSKLRTACLTPNASSLYFFRISLCLIHFRFIFVSFHVFSLFFHGLNVGFSTCWIAWGHGCHLGRRQIQLLWWCGNLRTETFHETFHFYIIYIIYI